MRFTSRPPRRRRVDVAAGDVVTITYGLLRGRTGRAVRPSRVVVDRGWMLELDRRFLGLRRLRVATWALEPGRPPS